MGRFVEEQDRRLDFFCQHRLLIMSPLAGFYSATLSTIPAYQ
jgi:hypothetical protein